MVNVPLRLWNRPHWELRGRPDSVRFFRMLRAAFPTATTLFIEGTSIAEDVRDFFDSTAEEEPYLPSRQTIWPKPRQFRLRTDEPTLTRLAELAGSHAETEVLDHLFVYAGSEPLLEYPDAFVARDDPMYVSHEVPEAQVRGFARELGLEVREMPATFREG